MNCLLQMVYNAQVNSSAPFVQALFPQAAGPPKRGRAPTLGGQFRTSLQELYVKLTSTAPHFIKCVKTNEVKRAGMFDSRFCLQQVEYLGLLEVVKIRRQGYPVRRTPENFVRRYAMLAEDCTRDAGAMLRLLGGEGLWQMGKTMVFMKDQQLTLLEAARAICLDKSVRILQRALAAFVKLGRWRKIVGGFRLLGPVCCGGHARGLVVKIRAVNTLATNLEKVLASMTPRFPPTPDVGALAVALAAAQDAPSSHGRRRVPGFDKLVVRSGEAAALQKRLGVEDAVMQKISHAMVIEDEEACIAALEEAAQLIPPLTAEPNSAESLLVMAAAFVRARAEARALAIARENAKDVLDNLSTVLAIDVEKPPPRNVEEGRKEGGGVEQEPPIASAMREKRNALRRAVEMARDSGAGADPRIAECEAAADAIGETLELLTSLADAVASGGKEKIAAAMSATAEKMEGMGAVGGEAVMEAQKALLDIELSEQLVELEKAQQALRGLGGRTEEEKALALRVDALIAQAARAGITLEKGTRGRPGRGGVVRAKQKHPLLSRAVLASTPYVVQLETLQAKFGDLRAVPCLAASQLSFRATGLQRPLTSFSAAGVAVEKREELAGRSVEAFSLLLGWCGAVWQREPAALGASLLAECAAEPLLRDELYMQMMMQCGDDNPDVFIAKRCWQMLGLYIESGLLPSPVLWSYVEVFLFRMVRGETNSPEAEAREGVGLLGGSTTGPEAELVGIAQSCLRQLARFPGGRGGASRVPEPPQPSWGLPDEHEISSRFLSENADLRRLYSSERWVDVQLPDGTVRSFALDDETTVCELLLSISVSLRVLRIDTYALYEIGGKDPNSGKGGFDTLEGTGALRAVALDSRLNVAAHMRDWASADAARGDASVAAAMAAAAAVGVQMRPGAQRRLALSKRLHVERASEVSVVADGGSSGDLVELHLLYSQALGCVMRGKYTPDEQADSVDLAALSIQAEYGDHDPEAHTSAFLRSELAKHIPPVQHGTRLLTGWDASLVATHRKLAGLSAAKAQEGYVKRCMACCAGYGVTLFRATQTHHEAAAPATVLLGVSVDGVTVRPTTDVGTVLEHYRFQKLKSWGASGPGGAQGQGVVRFRVLHDPGYHTLTKVSEPSDPGVVEYVLEGGRAAGPNNSAQGLCSLLRDYGLWLAARRKREQSRGR